MVVDNIECGRIVEGGIKDDKVYLKYYVVDKGLNELLMALSLH